MIIFYAFLSRYLVSDLSDLSVRLSLCMICLESLQRSKHIGGILHKLPGERLGQEAQTTMRRKFDNNVSEDPLEEADGSAWTA